MSGKIKRTRVDRSEADEDSEEIRGLGEQINSLSNDTADVDHEIGEEKADYDQHQEEYFWIPEHQEGEKENYYAVAFLVILIPILEILFIGLQATGDPLKAIVAPVAMTAIQVLLLASIERKKLELNGNKLPPFKIDPKELKFSLWPMKPYPWMVAFKWVNILLLAGWALFVSVQADIDAIVLHNEMAVTSAIVTGGQVALKEVPGFWYAALTNPMALFYGFMVFAAHTLLAVKSWDLFLAYTYFVGYRRKYRRLKKRLRELNKQRRELITEIGERYSYYKSRLARARWAWGHAFREPEVAFSAHARAYIAEARSRPAGEEPPSASPPPGGAQTGNGYNHRVEFNR